MTETIQMWKAKNQKGDVISKRYYDQLSVFIIGKLKKTNGISLIELIELANIEISKDFDRSISCLLLNVKKDLEVMGIIKVEKFPDYTQFITLSRQNSRRYSILQKIRKIESPHKIQSV